MAEELEITTLTNTTSLHDDWLHRGPFLVDLDLHTYIAHVVRIPRPTKARITDIQRVENVFPFDEHYELAKSHWQQLRTDGHHALPMLEALRCQPPDFNNGEDNAVYKTLFGSLFTCPGKSRCCDPLLYRSAFFPPLDKKQMASVLSTLVKSIADSSGRHDEQRLRFWPQELRRSVMPPSVFPSLRTRCCSALMPVLHSLVMLRRR